MHVHLHEWRVAGVPETVNLAGLDLLAVHLPQPTPLPYELDLVVRVTMRAWPLPGKRVEQEDGHGDVAVVGADELMRAADERQVLLADAVHGCAVSDGCGVKLPKLPQ